MFTNLAYKIHYTRGADLASATQLPLFSDGDYFKVSGTTTITSLKSLGKGMQVVLEFESILTIVHDGTNLILPEGANITTTAGSTYRFLEYDLGQWICILAGSGSGGGGGSFSSHQTSAVLDTSELTNPDFATDLSGWVNNGGWSWTAGGGVTHTAGTGTSTLEQQLASPLPHETMYVGWICENMTAGSARLNIGSWQVRIDEEYIESNSTRHFSYVPSEISAELIKLTPTDDFDGTIKLVEMCTLLEQATPQITFYDDTNTLACEILCDDTLDNTFMGSESGVMAVYAHDNACFGKDTGKALTVGYNNTFAGKDTGEDVTTGSNNSFYGIDAGNKCITGNSNTFIGEAAGYTVEDSEGSTCIGQGCGSASVGNYDTFIGNGSGNARTGGAYNVAIGRQALRIGSSSYNVAIGNKALGNTAGGGTNIAIGNAAAEYTGSGANNVVIGNEAAFNNLGIDDNVIIGDKAAKYITGGTTAFETESDGIYIGAGVTGNVNAESNAIVIGKDAASLGSNKTVIGNTSTTDIRLYGNLDIPAGQIVFPATQIPSANANTLDDYEEGTWTPTLEFGGASVSLTYTEQFGSYTKVGNLIHLHMFIKINSKGTSTGQAKIIGVPFAPDNSYGRISCGLNLWQFALTYTDHPEAKIDYSTTEIQISNTTGAGAYANLTNSNFHDGCELVLDGTYRV